MRLILERGLHGSNGSPWRLDCVALLGGKLLVAGLVLVSGFTSLSGDEAGRALIAHAWAQRPFLFSPEFGTSSVMWLPLPFWLLGSILTIWKDLWLVPLVVSLSFTLIGLYFLFRIGTVLFDRRTGFLSAALFGILPWNTWLSLTAAAEPLYHGFLLAGFYHFVRWLQTEGRPHLWLASAGFFLAGMVRPEAWGFAGIYGLWVLAKGLSVQGSRIGWVERSSAAVLALGFCLVWLGINYVYYGHPLYFLTLNWELGRVYTWRIESASLRLFRFPLLLFAASPTLATLSLLALPWAWKREGGETKGYLAVVGGTFCLLLLASLSGPLTAHSPQRFVLIFLALFSPFVASLVLQMLRQQDFRSRLVAIALAAFFLGNFAVGFSYVDRYEHVVAAGMHVGKLRLEKHLREGDRVVSELGVHILHGTFAGLPEPKKESLNTERLLLQAFSGHPEIFLDQGWAIEASKIALDEDRLNLLVVRSPAIARKVSNRYRLLCQIGPYLFFGKERFEPPCPAPNYPRAALLESVTLGGLYHVDRYALHPGALPNSVLIWLRPVSRDVPESRVLIRAEGRGGSYQEILPVRLLRGEALLVFPLQSELPPGTYTLRLSLLSEEGIGGPGQEEPDHQGVTLGPVTLIASKRAAAKALLKTGRFEPGVLLRLALTF